MPLVLLETKGPIAKIILNNPEQLNALTWEMAVEMEQTISDLQKNKNIRIVILTGIGKAFSAGGNLQFILDRTQKTPAQNKQEMIEFYSKFLAIRKLAVPTIAMINGPAVGAGFCLALCCDLRLAATDAKMGANFSKLGLSSGMGGLYWLNRLAGPAIAADLLFTGRLISAQEALPMGLVNEVIALDSLEKQTFEKAQAIAANAPLPLQIMKQGLQKMGFSTLEEVFDYESGGQAQCFGTEDLKEGIAAIQEKRVPSFSGI